MHLRGRRVIAKVARDDRAFRANAATPDFLATVGLAGSVPELLGTIRPARLLLLEELAGPSLADLLLDGDAVAAGAALAAEAALLGEMSARTQGKMEAFERLGGPPPYPVEELLRPFAGATAAVLALPDLGDELEQLEDFWRAGARAAFSPLDTCPDNNAWAAGRLRLFDLDFAGFQHPALTYSYFDVAWPTCWCLAALPVDLQAQLRRVFLERCPVSVPEAALAAACWAVFNIGSRLPQALEADQPIAPRSPTALRAMLLWRSEEAVRRLSDSGGLPRLRVAFADLSDRLRELWPGTGALPAYPAFSSL